MLSFGGATSRITSYPLRGFELTAIFRKCRDTRSSYYVDCTNGAN
jgi:hypothetical protein